MGVLCLSLFCYALLCIHPSFAIIFCNCYMALPNGAVVGLQCVTVVFPDHTHLLYDILSPLGG